MTRFVRRRMIPAAAVLAVVLSACGTSGSDDTARAEGGSVDLIATTTIWGDVVSRIVGAAAVEVLAPIGADPHDFQASSQQAAAIVNADLTVANGLDLEEGMVFVLESAEEDGANVLEIAPLLDPLPFGDEEVCDPDEDHDDGADHDHGSCDPHIWMDPIRVAAAAPIIAEQLAAIDSQIDWAAAADEYADELIALDAEIEEILSVVSEDNRVLVTNHDSLGYFADRYGFETIGIIIPGGSTIADPSSGELAELVDTMRKAGVTAIFAETTVSSVLAEALADELGGNVEVVELYTGSLGEPGSGADTLIGMLRTDAELIAAALS